jgi:hypothetical protein
MQDDQGGCSSTIKGPLGLPVNGRMIGQMIQGLSTAD